MSKLHWERRNKSDPTWTSGRFSIEWAGRKKNPVACYVLYDAHTKKHYYGFINHGRAQDLAQAIVNDNVYKIGLVACCAEKLEKPSRAFELYQSDLFKKAVDYCRRHYNQWFILSAQYGLVNPNDVIEPYDRKLKASDGEDWAHKVVVKLGLPPSVYGRTLYYAHAGKLYTDPLLADVPMTFPMKGLGIGQQLAWYKEKKDADHQRSIREGSAHPAGQKAH